MVIKEPLGYTLYYYVGVHTKVLYNYRAHQVGLRTRRLSLVR